MLFIVLFVEYINFLIPHKAMDMFDMGDGFESLEEGVARVRCPVLVLGVTSDILFPVEQQREMANLLQKTG